MRVICLCTDRSTLIDYFLNNHRRIYGLEGIPAEEVLDAFKTELTESEIQECAHTALIPYVNQLYSVDSFGTVVPVPPKPVGTRHYVPVKDGLGWVSYENGETDSDFEYEERLAGEIVDNYVDCLAVAIMRVLGY